MSDSYRKSQSDQHQVQQWNIPNTNTNPIPPSVQSQSVSSHSQSSSDYIKSSNENKSFEELLFDSGYSANSPFSSVSGISSSTNIQSETNLDTDFSSKVNLEDETHENVAHKSDSSAGANNKNNFAKKWEDSGVCITDSGLHVEMEEEEEEEEGEDKEIVLEQKHEKQQFSVPGNVTFDKNSKYTDLISLRAAFQPDQDGDTLLHLAMIQQMPQVAFGLIRLVPHPDFLDSYNHLSQTPLHLATLTKQASVVRRLIISGATLDMRDRYGNTALHIACQQNDFDSVKAIISPITDKEIKEASVLNYPIQAQCLPLDLINLRNYEGETCMHLAAYNENKKIMEYLVQCGADINAKEGKSGRSALHWAVEGQKYDLVMFLLKRCKANVNISSYAGHTPLHLAWSLLYSNPNCVRVKTLIKFLRDCGGEPAMPAADSDFDNDDDSSDEADGDDQDHTNNTANNTANNHDIKSKTK